MLQIVEGLPEGLLQREAHRLHEVLAGPTLMHLPGRRAPPLFVSVLLHGNEDTGWRAVQGLLRRYAGRELPRALSLFIGNVAAAARAQRLLAGQPDYNRIWGDLPGMTDTPERRMARQVVETMKTRGVFASVDIHNNTGRNPHYACVRRLDPQFLHLATLFGRTVVYFLRPTGVLTEPVSGLGPAVTVECGQPGEAAGTGHALDYLQACLNLAEIPRHRVAACDIDLFHTVAIVRVPPDVSFGFGAQDADIRLMDDLDHLNFREVPADTTLGWVRPGSGAHLEVRGEDGQDLSARFLRVDHGEIRTAVPVMPSMLTVNEQAIRQDCLGYLMQRHAAFPAVGTEAARRRRSH